MAKQYHKLVRDKIPAIITAGGGGCRVETLEQQAFIRALEEKLSEELAEYLESRSLEELADLQEVIRALVAARGEGWEELERLRLEKREKRGGFDRRLLLLEVTP
ncbi:MAG: nucleoside triphosphate pyrophosphohydrolase [Oscillospiraceae bacterium]|nr:nucleoside triphosphate pyrophosphohydrolase [Oscillospiraceae bacterium]